MQRSFNLLAIAFLLLLPNSWAGYPELMKAVQLNTGQPKWEHLGQGRNPASGENTSLDVFLDLNSIQNIATPWIAYKTMEVYTPYSTSISQGKKVSSVTSSQLLNCQTKTEVPLQFLMLSPDKQVVTQKLFTEAMPRSSAPNSPSSRMSQIICDIAYHERPQPQLSSSIVPIEENKKGPDWVAFAESRKPDKTVVFSYDKKSFIRKNNDLLFYSTRETYTPFTLMLLQNQKVTSRITRKIANCRSRQEAIISRTYYGINGVGLKTQLFDKNAFQENNPQSIEKIVQNEVCLFIDSLPNTD